MPQIGKFLSQPMGLGLLILITLIITLPLPSMANRDTLNDQQAKQVRETSQIILRSRLIEKQQTQTALLGVRQQQALLQKLIIELEQAMRAAQMQVHSSRPTHANTLVGGSLVIEAKTNTAYRYDQNTGLVTSQQQNLPATESANQAQPVLTRPLQNNQSARIQSTRQALDRLQSELQAQTKPKPGRWWRRLRSIFRFNQQDLAEPGSHNPESSIEQAPRLKLLALTRDAQAILQAFENQQPQALERLAKLKTRVALQKHQGRLADVKPTLVNRHQHKMQ